MRPPRIAVSARVSDDGGKHRTGVHVDYIHAVAAAGGVPVVLSPLMKVSHAADALAGCGALVLSGGEDVHPSHYGAAPSPHLKKVDPVRDRFELALFRAAQDRSLPVLAICRGLQLVNVALGGTLWQDLPTEWRGSQTLDHDTGEKWATRTHPVTVEPSTRLAQALGHNSLLVNSFHHQAVRQLAPGLAVTAQAPDGLCEAIESTDGVGWVLGVQWHPESFWEEGGPDLGVFRAVVEEARRRESARA